MHSIYSSRDLRNIHTSRRQCILFHDNVYILSVKILYIYIYIERDMFYIYIST